MKPCPFCGSEDIENTEDAFDWMVNCNSCGASANIYPDEEAAVRAWNMRFDFHERLEFSEIVTRLKQRGVLPETFDASRLEVANG